MSLSHIVIEFDFLNAIANFFNKIFYQGNFKILKIINITKCPGEATPY